MTVEYNMETVTKRYGRVMKQKALVPVTYYMGLYRPTDLLFVYRC